MPNSTLKLKYNSVGNKLQSTVGVWWDEVKLKLQITEKTLKDAGKVQEDALLAIEKPGHFIVEHHLHKKDTRLQFHSHADILTKTLKLTFIHHIGPGVTTLEASTAFNRQNKLTLKHNFAKSGPLVKYELNKFGYALEPQYDFGLGKSNAWGLSLKSGIGKNFFKATYIHHKQEAELEVQRMTGRGGPIKVTATVDVTNPKAIPKFILEKEFKVLGSKSAAPGAPKEKVVIPEPVFVSLPEVLAPPIPMEWYEQEPWKDIKTTVDDVIKKVLPPKA